MNCNSDKCTQYLCQRVNILQKELSTKITEPKDGDIGQVLTKVADGVEWEDGGGGGGGGVNIINAISLNDVNVPPINKRVSLVVNKDTVGLGNVDDTSDANKPISNAVNTQLNNKPNNAQLGRATQGASKGIATLDESGKVPLSQIPEEIASKVDQSQIGKETVGDLQGVCPLGTDGKINPTYIRGGQGDFDSYATKADFPDVGIESILYVAEDTNLTYRWNGNGYSDLDASLAIGITTGTAFDGKRGRDLEVEMLLKASNEDLQAEINTRIYAVKDLKETKVNKTAINKPTTEGVDGEIGIAGLDKQGKLPTNLTIVGQIDDFNFNPLSDVQFKELVVGETMQISSRQGSVAGNTPPFINPTNTVWNGTISRNGSQGFTVIIYNGGANGDYTPLALGEYDATGNFKGWISVPKYQQSQKIQLKGVNYREIANKFFDTRDFTTSLTDGYLATYINVPVGKMVTGFGDGKNIWAMGKNPNSKAGFILVHESMMAEDYGAGILVKNSSGVYTINSVYADFGECMLRMARYKGSDNMPSGSMCNYQGKSIPIGSDPNSTNNSYALDVSNVLYNGSKVVHADKNLRRGYINTVDNVCSFVADNTSDYFVLAVESGIQATGSIKCFRAFFPFVFYAYSEPKTGVELDALMVRPADFDTQKYSVELTDGVPTWVIDPTIDINRRMDLNFIYGRYTDELIIDQNI